MFWSLNKIKLYKKITVKKLKFNKFVKNLIKIPRKKIKIDGKKTRMFQLTAQLVVVENE